MGRRAKPNLDKIKQRFAHHTDDAAHEITNMSGCDIDHLLENGTFNLTMGIITLDDVVIEELKNWNSSD